MQSPKAFPLILLLLGLLLLSSAPAVSASPDAPNKPTNLLPSIRQITTDVTISCVVTDNDGDRMNVHFHDNSDNSLIDNVWADSGATASVTWSDLTRSSTYVFFARAQDNNGNWGENSDTQSFRVNTLPTIPTDYTNLGIENNTPTITWTEGTDADDGDIVTTFIYLGDSAAPIEIDGATTDEIFTLGENASHSTYPLENGSTYYYRLNSWDHYEYSSYTLADEFEIYTENILTLYPIHDSYVIQNSSGETSGDMGVFVVRTRIDYNTRAFLNFDLSELGENEVYSATLRIYCYAVTNMNEAAHVELRKVWDDNWTETTLTWSNQPAILGFADYAHDTEPVVGWMEWDITDYANEQLVDDNLSIALKCWFESWDDVSRGSYYRSKEYNGFAPQLVITYGEEEEEPEWENVIITSTTGGSTIPVEDNYLYLHDSSITLTAVSEFGYDFVHWEIYIPEYEWYENENSASFTDSIVSEVYYHAVFTEGEVATIISALATIISIGVVLAFCGVGFGLSKGDTTVATLFLLLGMMLVSVFEIFPAWIFYISFITFIFVTIWKHSRREGESDA